MEKYRIVVSEPWNYTNDAGENCITGTILRLINTRCIVFQADEVLYFGPNIEGKTLILSSRFELPERNKIKLPVTVNGGLLMTDYDPSWDTDDL